MNALFAARRFDKCACVGVYTGTQNWLSSGTRSLELDPHARARDVREERRISNQKAAAAAAGLTHEELAC